MISEAILIPQICQIAGNRIKFFKIFWGRPPDPLPALAPLALGSGLRPLPPPPFPKFLDPPLAATDSSFSVVCNDLTSSLSVKNVVFFSFGMSSGGRRRGDGELQRRRTPSPARVPPQRSIRRLLPELTYLGKSRLLADAGRQTARRRSAGHSACFASPAESPSWS